MTLALLCAGSGDGVVRDYWSWLAQPGLRPLGLGAGAARQPAALAN